MSDVEEQVEDEDDSSEASSKNPPSQTLAIELEEKLEKSDIHELGWRNRDDLDDVKNDFEKLAQQDPKTALELWEKYKPDTEEKPSFLPQDSQHEEQDQQQKKDGEIKQGVKGEEEEESLSESQRLAVEVLRKMMRERGDSEEAVEVLSKKAIERIKKDYSDQEPVLKMYDKIIAVEQKNTVRQEVQGETKDATRSRRC